MRKICFVLFVFAAAISSLFSQSSKTLVVRVELNQEAHKKYSEYEKSYVNAAYRQFQQDLTKEPQIQIRTPETDTDLRNIQKESQIDASKGWASEESAYATDKGSRALLSMRLQMSKVGKEYQLSCEVREIEKMSMVQRNTQKLSLEQVSGDIEVDRLAYEVLVYLQEKKYIDRVSLDITNQLLHRDDANSEENLKKYIENYAKQRREVEAELAALRADTKSQEDKLAKEAKERALQLNLELAQKNQQIAEENLRRQKEKNIAEAKRQDELKKITAAQQKKMVKDFEAIDAARRAIQKESWGKLSLERRIELIESAKENMRQLKKQLDDTIGQNRSEMTQKMQEELNAKDQEPWRKADLSNGEPTERARKFREDEKKAIRKRYETQMASDETNLRVFAEPRIKDYEAQINSNLEDMQKTIYVFRSIDEVDDYLSLQVDEYDGDAQDWKVNSAFGLPIAKADTSAVVLPAVPITYRMMVGKTPDLDTAEGYEKYQDDVDTADFYFRAKVPYLYSELSIKVSYNAVSDTYIFLPQQFSIYRTQDNSHAIASYDAKELAQIQKKHENELKRQAEKEREEQEAQQRSYEREINREKFLAKQKARKGVYLDIGYANHTSFYGAVGDVSLLWGGKYLFGGCDFTIIGVSDKCFDTAVYKSVSLLSMDGVVGLSVRLGLLRPYIAGGIGFYGGYNKENTGSKKASTENLVKNSGLIVLGEAGFDLVFGSFAVGGVYKLRNYAGTGVINTFAVSLGYNWN